MGLQSECVARCLRVLRGGAGKSGIGRVDERGYDSRFRHHLVQHVYRFCTSSVPKLVTPVAFPPGRLRLATSPSATGSDAVEKMIGIVVVAALAASADGVPAAAITAT